MYLPGLFEKKYRIFIIVSLNLLNKIFNKHNMSSFIKYVYYFLSIELVDVSNNFSCNKFSTLVFNSFLATSSK